MKTKPTHTPAPWELEYWDSPYDYDVWEISGDLNLPNGFKDRIIAKVYFYEANARLIASAPELLEALKDSIKFLNSDMTNKENQAAFKKIIENAIVKAEGDL